MIDSFLCFARRLESPILLVQLLVLPDEKCAKRQGQESVEKHECRADTLSLDEAWLLVLRKHPRPQQGPALTDEIQQHDTMAVSIASRFAIPSPRHLPHASS